MLGRRCEATTGSGKLRDPVDNAQRVDVSAFLRRRRLAERGPDSMATYWIVVRQDNAELYDALAVAFRGRTGFTVIRDRRSGESRRRGRFERRGPRQTEWGPDEFIVAERHDPIT